jgi:V-type H+-transporting ATPase subunit D
MDEALKVTNRRVNALENVTIPKIETILADINRELDELEREDFTRLKKVQSKKTEKIKEEEDAMAEKVASAGGGGGKRGKGGNGGGDVMSGFDAADDEEVLFF